MPQHSFRKNVCDILQYPSNTQPHKTIEASTPIYSEARDGVGRSGAPKTLNQLGPALPNDTIQKPFIAPRPKGPADVANAVALSFPLSQKPGASVCFDDDFGDGSDFILDVVDAASLRAAFLSSSSNTSSSSLTSVSSSSTLSCTTKSTAPTPLHTQSSGTTTSIAHAEKLSTYTSISPQIVSSIPASVALSAAPTPTPTPAAALARPGLPTKTSFTATWGDAMSQGSDSPANVEDYSGSLTHGDGNAEQIKRLQSDLINARKDAAMLRLKNKELTSKHDKQQGSDQGALAILRANLLKKEKEVYDLQQDLATVKQDQANKATFFQLEKQVKSLKIERAAQDAELVEVSRAKAELQKAFKKEQVKNQLIYQEYQDFLQRAKEKEGVAKAPIVQLHHVKLEDSRPMIAANESQVLLPPTTAVIPADALIGPARKRRPEDVGASVGQSGHKRRRVPLPVDCLLASQGLLHLLKALPVGEPTGSGVPRLAAQLEDAFALVLKEQLPEHILLPALGQLLAWRPLVAQGDLILLHALQTLLTLVQKSQSCRACVLGQTNRPLRKPISSSLAHMTNSSAVSSSSLLSPSHAQITENSICQTLQPALQGFVPYVGTGCSNRPRRIYIQKGHALSIGSAISSEIEAVLESPGLLRALLALMHDWQNYPALVIKICLQILDALLSHDARIEPGTEFSLLLENEVLPSILGRGTRDIQSRVAALKVLTHLMRSAHNLEWLTKKFRACGPNTTLVEFLYTYYSNTDFDSTGSQYLVLELRLTTVRLMTFVASCHRREGLDILVFKSLGSEEEHAILRCLACLLEQELVRIEHASDSRCVILQVHLIREIFQLLGLLLPHSNISRQTVVRGISQLFISLMTKFIFKNVHPSLRSLSDQAQMLREFLADYHDRQQQRT